MHRFALAVLIICLVLTACGSKATHTPDHVATQVAVLRAAAATATAEAPTVTPTSTDTPSPTATPTPTPTATAAATVPGNWEEYEDIGGHFTLMRPPHWVIHEQSEGLVVFDLSSESNLSTALFVRIRSDGLEPIGVDTEETLSDLADSAMQQAMRVSADLSTNQGIDTDVKLLDKGIWENQGYFVEAAMEPSAPNLSKLLGVIARLFFIFAPLDHHSVMLELVKRPPITEEELTTLSILVSTLHLKEPLTSTAPRTLSPGEMPTPLPTGTPSSMPTATAAAAIRGDWKQYENIGGRFTLMYPPTWEINRQEVGSVFFDLSKPGEYVAVTILDHHINAVGTDDERALNDVNDLAMVVLTSAATEMTTDGLACDAKVLDRGVWKDQGYFAKATIEPRDPVFSKLGILPHVLLLFVPLDPGSVAVIVFGKMEPIASEEELHTLDTLVSSIHFGERMTSVPIGTGGPTDTPTPAPRPVAIVEAILTSIEVTTPAQMSLDDYTQLIEEMISEVLELTPQIVEFTERARARDVDGVCAVILYDASAFLQRMASAVPPPEYALYHQYSVLLFQEYQAFYDDKVRFCETRNQAYVVSASQHCEAAGMYGTLIQQEGERVKQELLRGLGQ